MCCQGRRCLLFEACEALRQERLWRIQTSAILVSIRRNGYTCFQIMARRFFRFSIQDLEALFNEKNNNVDALLALEDELSHRKTERAARLRSQVEERLVVLRPKPSSREQTSAEPPPFRSSQQQSVSSSQEEQHTSILIRLTLRLLS